MGGGWGREVHGVPSCLRRGVEVARARPEMVGGVERKLPGVRIRVAPPLDGHPGLMAVLLDRARQALEEGAGAP